MIENLPEGFIFISEFMTLDEEKILIQHLEQLDWQQVKMHGVIAKRRVVHFGYDYTYSTRRISPTTPAPSFLSPYINRAATRLNVHPTQLAEILITEYPINAGIGWHKDAPLFETVFGISLAATCTLKLRIRKDDYWIVVKQELPPCSAYILSGDARTKWQHSIPAVKEKRYSITFRTLKK